MATKKIKSAKVRDILGQIMEEVYYKGNDYIIEKGNKPMVVIIPIDEYLRIRKEREGDFKVFDRIWERNKNINPDEVENDIDEAVREVRARKKR